MIKEIQCKAKCSAKSTAEEDWLSEPETLAADGDEAREDENVEQHQSSLATTTLPTGSKKVASSLSDSLSLGIREPVYEVFFFFSIPLSLFSISNVNFIASRFHRW